MIDFQRILSPVDFSAHSRFALDYAVAISRWYDSRVTVLHVAPPVDPTGELGYDAAVLEGAREDALSRLKRFVAEEVPSSTPVESVVREGVPVVEILRMSQEMPADLVVLGSHGRSGFDRLMLGSVTEKTLRRASSPVLVVPRRMPEAVPARGPLFREILCPTDFSESSLAGLAHAISLATEADARLTLLHVIAHELDETDVPVLLAATDLNMTVAEFRRHTEEDVRARLGRLIPVNAADACRIQSTVCRGKPWRTILKVAEENQTDVIVMGVQGRSAADLMFLGSTTQHVVRQAACPVLTVRAH